MSRTAEAMSLTAGDASAAKPEIRSERAGIKPGPAFVRFAASKEVPSAKVNCLVSGAPWWGSLGVVLPRGNRGEFALQAWKGRW